MIGGDHHNQRQQILNVISYCLVQMLAVRALFTLAERSRCISHNVSRSGLYCSQAKVAKICDFSFPLSQQVETYISSRPDQVSGTEALDSS
jgi:hypothetical protein